MAKLKLVVCSVRIPFEPERKAVMAWVRTVANRGYSEDGDVIHMSYAEEPDDRDSNSRYWAVVHYFQQYPDSEVIQSEF